VATLLDSNVLVHAAVGGSPLHEVAALLVDKGLRRGGLYCIAPQNLVEFAAVVTRRRFVDPPLAADVLRRMTERLYRSRRLRKIYPSRGTVVRAMREGTSLGVSGPRWYDLFLAVTMRDTGVREIITENLDDFRRISFVTARTMADAL
jgi:predicted nucleic acid-binding protein